MSILGEVKESNMNQDIDIVVSSAAYVAGVPVLFLGVVAASTTLVSAGAAILTIGWLAMVKAGLKMAKAKREKQK